MEELNKDLVIFLRNILMKIVHHIDQVQDHDNLVVEEIVDLVIYQKEVDFKEVKIDFYIQENFKEKNKN